ncbi:hypothetical protein K438DRAFT_1749494 [Mycena galopus ATCC 62051]|nr:hypothetical protein K438DRAFT_1749494 [Mycena galopus ATCC 62051]
MTQGHKMLKDLCCKTKDATAKIKEAKDVIERPKMGSKDAEDDEPNSGGGAPFTHAGIWHTNGKRQDPGDARHSEPVASDSVFDSFGLYVVLVLISFGVCSRNVFATCNMQSTSNSEP